MRAGSNGHSACREIAELDSTGQEVVNSGSDKTFDFTTSIFGGITTIFRGNTNNIGIFNKKGISRRKVSERDFDTASEIISSPDVLELDSTKSFTDDSTSKVLPTQEVGELSRNWRIVFIRSDGLARIGTRSQFMEDSEAISTT